MAVKLNGCAIQSVVMASTNEKTAYKSWVLWLASKTQ